MARARVHIVGAGGFGRECVGNFRLWNGFADRFEIAGFIDDNPRALDGYGGYPAILGAFDSIRPGADDLYVCALGAPVLRRRVRELIASRGGRLGTFISPRATVHAGARLGAGVLVLDGAVVSADVRLGENVLCQLQSVLGHDTRVGDDSVVGCFAFTGGFAEVGAGVALYTRATVLPSKKVGPGAVVGAGAVVLANVAPGVTVFGNPALPIQAG